MKNKHRALRKNKSKNGSDQLFSLKAKESTPIQKQSSESASAKGIRKKEMGFNGLLLRHLGSRLSLVDDEAVIDLAFPNNLDTFAAMHKDPAVDVAINAKTTLILKALGGMRVVAGDLDDAESVAAADFTRWNFENLPDGKSFVQVVEDFLTYNTYGFSLVEKSYPVIKEGEYKGRQQFKLSPRAQRSLDMNEPFTFSDDMRTLISVNQQKSKVAHHGFFFNTDVDSDNLIKIPAARMMVFSYKGYNGNLFGNSPLKAVYVAWKEKKIFEEYQTIAAVKNLVGTPISRVPIEVLNKAQADSTSSQGQFLQNHMSDLANFHAGDQAYMLMPSDRDDKGHLLFDTNLMGVDGSNQSMDLVGAINQRKQAILDAFGAGFISLGNEGGGSYAMMDGKVSVHEALTARDINFILGVLQQQLIPQLLALNDIRLPNSKMPKLIAAPISEQSWADISVAIQRMQGVSFFPRSVVLVNEILEKMGMDYRIDKEMTDETLKDLLEPPESKSGMGMANSAAEGTSTKVGGKDSSVSNNANKA